MHTFSFNSLYKTTKTITVANQLTYLVTKPYDAVPSLIVYHNKNNQLTNKQKRLQQNTGTLIHHTFQTSILKFERLNTDLSLNMYIERRIGQDQIFQGSLS